MDSVEKYFNDLGHAVEARWARFRNSELAFPEIAAEVLTHQEPPPEASSLGVLRLLSSISSLVRQEPLGFGEPPITLFRSRDFAISALVWLDGSTAVHQHGFSGAFRLLEGSSIHVEYNFAVADMITRRLLLGDLQPQGAELLQRGDVRRITAGSDFIHALFHLDRPSVTVVVRTNSESLGVPRFGYFAPGLAYDPFFKDDGLHRRLVGLQSLYAIDRGEALDCACELIEGNDILASFLVTNHWFSFDRSERLDALLDTALRVHGSPAQMFPSVYEERRRKVSIFQRRRLLKDPTHRVLLALILNLPDCASIGAILRQRFPDESPCHVIGRCLDELSSPPHVGISGLSLSNSEKEEVRAILAENDDDAAKRAVDHLQFAIQGSAWVDTFLS